MKPVRDVAFFGTRRKHPAKPFFTLAKPRNPSPKAADHHRRPPPQTPAHLQIYQSEAAVRLKVSTVTLSRWECDKVHPTWAHHPRLIEYLGYDPFPACGLQDPYGNEPPGVAFLSSNTLRDRIRARRLELKLTVKECAKKLKVDAKTLHGWERQRHQLAPGMQKRLIEFLEP